MNLIGCLDTPTEGRYWLNGRPVEQLTLSERARTRNRELLQRLPPSHQAFHVVQRDDERS